jgi:hypothetical protein
MDFGDDLYADALNNGCLKWETDAAAGLNALLSSFVARNRGEHVVR